LNKFYPPLNTASTGKVICDEVNGVKNSKRFLDSNIKGLNYTQKITETTLYNIDLLCNQENLFEEGGKEILEEYFQKNCKNKENC
jgi:hypothetical protein